MSAPFELPAEPVDRYEVTWFSVSSAGGETEVHEHRAVYHVNSTWAEVCPDSDRPGVDFVDHWQIFYDGRFSGRSHDGWRALVDRSDATNWRFTFATRKAAVAQACEWLLEDIERARKRIVEMQQQLVTYQQELRSGGPT